MIISRKRVWCLSFFPRALSPRHLASLLSSRSQERVRHWFFWRVLGLKHDSRSINGAVTDLRLCLRSCMTSASSCSCAHRTKTNDDDSNSNNSVGRLAIVLLNRLAGKTFHSDASSPWRAESVDWLVSYSLIKKSTLGNATSPTARTQ